ncbi:MAG: hypothetical protein B7Y51_10250 [Burkholderiales bacterium 28-67-8]|nr:MAG: hypothetical protein B7Y51_10250 [Burkholderiales bacterium 28-67-8]
MDLRKGKGASAPARAPGETAAGGGAPPLAHRVTLNDIAVGIALYTAAAPNDTRALFALGWLASQREAALTACRPDLKRFIQLPRFWRGKDDQASRGSKAEKGGKADKRSKGTPGAPRAG